MLLCLELVLKFVDLLLDALNAWLECLLATAHFFSARFSRLFVHYPHAILKQSRYISKFNELFFNELVLQDLDLEIFFKLTVLFSKVLCDDIHLLVTKSVHFLYLVHITDVLACALNDFIHLFALIVCCISLCLHFVNREIQVIYLLLEGLLLRVEFLL